MQLVSRNRRVRVSIGLERQLGYTLVELMVAITIGLLVTASLTTVFVNNLQNRGEVENVNQQTENGRYALQLLSDDLRVAGFLAEYDPRVLVTPAAKPDPCATDIPTLVSALALPVQGYDQGTSPPSCLSDLRAGSDILVIRRASTCSVTETGCDALSTGPVFFQASACFTNGELPYVLDSDQTKLTLHKKDCATIAPIYQYRTHIYFVANNDKSGDGIPTLKRAELGASGNTPTFTIVPLVEGIEDVQLEYGLDTSTPAAGSPAAFTADPDKKNSCSSTTTPTCTAYWANSVAAKIHVLARSPVPTANFSTDKTYYLGLQADGTSAIDGPYTDAYRRHVYESTVRINNVAGRNLP